MKSIPFALTVASFVFAVASMTPSVVSAQATAPAAAAPAAAEPASPFSWNVGLVTDYRYRGISQSRLKPAVSAGADYAHSSGFYVGGWASTIKWIKDAGGGANVELDLYGGYKFEVVKDVTLDVGTLAYVYPSNDLKPTANTQEIYVAASYGPLTAKYSLSLTNLFGFANSKRSGYFEVNGTWDLGNGFGFAGHIGNQSVAKNGQFSYTDYKFGVTKDIQGFVFGGAIVGANNKNYVGPAPASKNLGKPALLLSVNKTF
jgi:uncharacterized protein (TIGR02001 family)